MPVLRPVVLSGGSGTRLWPLSTPELPKQFVPLFGGRSLFAMTLDRLVGLPGLEGTVVVTGNAFQGLVQAEMAVSPLEAQAIIVEPVGRNTAPAAIAAALVSNPGDILIILPSDHVVTDVAAFRTAIDTAAELARDGAIVTFGVRPSRAETGYGYIEVGAERGRAFGVARFKEKPDEVEAAMLAGDGRHLWNSGMFVARSDHLLAEAKTLCPEVMAGVERAMPSGDSGILELAGEFASVESISMDHAIMEKTDRALVLPIDVGWDDVGSYRSLLDISEHDQDGNHVSGDVTLSDVSDSLVKATSRRVVVAGVSDIVVVETPDAVLVVPLDRAQEVRDFQQRANRG